MSTASPMLCCSFVVHLLQLLTAQVLFISSPVYHLHRQIVSLCRPTEVHRKWTNLTYELQNGVIIAAE